MRVAAHDIPQAGTKAAGEITGKHAGRDIPFCEGEKFRLVRDLGGNTYLMLRNHGLLTVGATPADAFVAMYFFEAACMIQVRAQAGGSALLPIAQPILDGIKQQIAAVTRGMGAGALVWPGLLRRLDRRNPGYAE
ncbi:adducin [Burkholderia stabilis]|nr:adducin [Burkholderia stabilis]